MIFLASDSIYVQLCMYTLVSMYKYVKLQEPLIVSGLLLVLLLMSPSIKRSFKTKSLSAVNANLDYAYQLVLNKALVRTNKFHPRSNIVVL